MHHRHLSYKAKLIIWVVLIKLFIKVKILFSALLFSSKVGLFPAEAEYWTWSHALSYAYFNKPLAIAYQIAGGCALFGDTELGIRAGAFLLSCALSLALYYLGKKAALPEKMAFIAALALTVTPLGFSSTFMATAQSGALLFWTLACATFVEDLMEQKPVRFLWIGLFIGIGSLFTWTPLLLWIPILTCAIYYKKISRAQLPHLILGLCISLLALTPTIIWNIHHDFALVRYCIDWCRELPQMSMLSLSLWIVQLEMISPLLLILVLIAFFKLLPRLQRLPPSLFFCLITTGFVLIPLSIAAIFKDIPDSLAFFAYPTAFTLLLGYANMQGKPFMRWVYGGMTLSCLILVTLTTLLILQKDHRDTIAVPYRINPFRQALGWDNLKSGLMQIGYDPASQFLFSDSNAVTAILSYYAPEKKRAYFLNIQETLPNQFSFWPGMHDEQLQRSGYFVGIEEGLECMDKAYLTQKKTNQILQNYFDSVTPTAIFIPLLDYRGKVMKVAYFIYCDGYNGKIPPTASRN